MQLKANPFNTGEPVKEFDLFAGRSDELRDMVEALYQVGNSKPKHKLVTGPRGVGKSSFINQIQSLAKDSEPVLQKLNVSAGDFRFRFAIAKHIAMPNQDVASITSSLISQLVDYT